MCVSVIARAYNGEVHPLLVIDNKDCVQLQYTIYVSLLCFLIQSQKAVHHGNTINTHHDVKRQTGNDCQCKDGTPSPISPPGKKGVQGTPGVAGPKGDTGPRGDPGDRDQED